MTLAELIKQAKAVGSQLSTADIPLVQDGKEVDLRLSLNDDLTVKVEKVVPDIKSPFSGGPVVEEWVTQRYVFRETPVHILKRQYRCVDTGTSFDTAECEEDALWDVFRKYCEKKNISFYDLIDRYEKDNV